MGEQPAEETISSDDSTKKSMEICGCKILTNKLSYMKKQTKNITGDKI
jgi:hypothetical protein